MMRGVAKPVVHIKGETVDVIDNNDKDVVSLRVDQVAGCYTDVVFTRCVVPETN